jgi:hypothetical protein
VFAHSEFFRYFSVMAPQLFRRHRATGYYVGCFVVLRAADAPIGWLELVPRARGLKAAVPSRAFLRRPCPTVDRLNPQRRTEPRRLRERRSTAEAQPAGFGSLPTRRQANDNEHPVSGLSDSGAVR